MSNWFILGLFVYEIPTVIWSMVSPNIKVRKFLSAFNMGAVIMFWVIFFTLKFNK